MGFGRKKVVTPPPVVMEEVPTLLQGTKSFEDAKRRALETGDLALKKIKELDVAVYLPYLLIFVVLAAVILIYKMTRKFDQVEVAETATIQTTSLTPEGELIETTTEVTTSTTTEGETVSERDLAPTEDVFTTTPVVETITTVEELPLETGASDAAAPVSSVENGAHLFTGETTESNPSEETFTAPVVEDSLPIDKVSSSPLTDESTIEPVEVEPESSAPVVPSVAPEPVELEPEPVEVESEPISLVEEASHTPETAPLVENDASSVEEDASSVEEDASSVEEDATQATAELAPLGEKETTSVVEEGQVPEPVPSAEDVPKESEIVDEEVEANVEPVNTIDTITEGIEVPEVEEDRDDNASAEVSERSKDIVEEFEDVTPSVVDVAPPAVEDMTPSDVERTGEAVEDVKPSEVVAPDSEEPSIAQEVVNAIEEIFVPTQPLEAIKAAVLGTETEKESPEKTDEAAVDVTPSDDLVVVEAPASAPEEKSAFSPGFSSGMVAARTSPVMSSLSSSALTAAPLNLSLTGSAPSVLESVKEDAVQGFNRFTAPPTGVVETAKDSATTEVGKVADASEAQMKDLAGAASSEIGAVGESVAAKADDLASSVPKEVSSAGISAPSIVESAKENSASMVDSAKDTVEKLASAGETGVKDLSATASSEADKVSAKVDELTTSYPTEDTVSPVRNVTSSSSGQEGARTPPPMARTGSFSASIGKKIKAFGRGTPESSAGAATAAGLTTPGSLPPSGSDKHKFRGLVRKLSGILPSNKPAAPSPSH